MPLFWVLKGWVIGCWLAQNRIGPQERQIWQPVPGAPVPILGPDMHD
jgi:hypothetical protein